MSRKILICSDIHGALENFRAAFEEEAPLDLVLIAGDLGLERWKIDQVTGVTACAIVQGNNDRLRHPDLPVKREFTYEGKRFYMTHGHTMGVRNGVPRKFMALTRNLGADIVVFGHSHSYFEETVDGVMYLNPGAMAGNVITYTFTYMVLTIDGETVTVEKREKPVLW